MESAAAERTVEVVVSNGGPAGRAPKQMARDLLDKGTEGALAQGSEFDELKRELAGLAERGDVEAQTLLGAIELEIARNPAAARKWFERAAATGDSTGQRSLGFLYANGLGVRRSEKKAVALFRAAAEAGDGFAMFNLAAANIAKDGKYLSYAETVDLLEKAEGAGIVEAAAKLGDLLAADDRDEEALACYVRAASQGHIGAMNAAACWYRDGTAGSRDPVQSVRWFLTMLRHGNGDGLHEAGKVAGERNRRPSARRGSARGQTRRCARSARMALPGFVSHLGSIQQRPFGAEYRVVLVEVVTSGCAHSLTRSSSLLEDRVKRLRMH